MAKIVEKGNGILGLIPMTGSQAYATGRRDTLQSKRKATKKIPDDENKNEGMG